RGRVRRGHGAFEAALELALAEEGDAGPHGEGFVARHVEAVVPERARLVRAAEEGAEGHRRRARRTRRRGREGAELDLPRGGEEPVEVRGVALEVEGIHRRAVEIGGARVRALEEPRQSLR